MIKRIFKRNFCESAQKVAVLKTPRNIPSNLEHINPNIKDLSEKELNEIKAVGADYVIPRELVNNFLQAGVYQEDNVLTKQQGQSRGFLFNYLKRMNMFFDYNEVFRDFFQSLAKNDNNFLNLVAEPYLVKHIVSHLEKLRRKGFFIELESIRNKQEFEVIDVNLYKNLRINRYKNFENENINKMDDLNISSYFGGKYNVARVNNHDTSIFENNKPFILATTMKVTSPMKLSVFNQNLSLKVYGKTEQSNVSYIVRFETEMSPRELFSVAYNPNKKLRTRQTRIADFNEVLNGNPFLNEEIYKLVEESKI